MTHGGVCCLTHGDVVPVTRGSWRRDSSEGVCGVLRVTCVSSVLLEGSIGLSSIGWVWPRVPPPPTPPLPLPSFLSSRGQPLSSRGGGGGGGGDPYL